MLGGYHIRISLSNPAASPYNASSSSAASASYTHRPTPSVATSHKRTYIPNSLFEPLPSHTTSSPRAISRRNTVHHSKRPVTSHVGDSADSEHKDYRFGPIHVDWVDIEESPNMEISSSPTQSKKIAVGKEREGHGWVGPATASFIATNRTKSGSTDLPEGIVHIYREAPNSYAQAASASAKPTPSTTAPIPIPNKNDSSSAEAATKSEGVLMGVLAVPSWMTPSDFLTFVAPAADGMAHLRMIRDSAPNRSIVVISFRNEAEAAEFAEAYNGKQFNSMEPEICHVVRVLSVQIDTEDAIGQSISSLGLPGSAYELPTCPVCLERMDSAITGLVTVPCSHTFHCACLSKWGDSRCPVCRYSQTLRSSHPTSSNTRSSVPIPFTSSHSSRCMECPEDSPSTSNLWICLICGNIGCGRYRRAHAHAHYERTTHLYALELETQRVWDYAGDGYVHRLIQNKADGKLVELPSAASSMAMGGGGRDGPGGGPSAADALSAEKIEAIGIEYSYLLTSQLDSQRTFYENQTNELRSQIAELRSMVEGLTKEVDNSRTRAKEEEERRKKEEEERIAEIERARARAEKRAEKANELARALDKELKGERAVSEQLMKNLVAMKERVEKVEGEKEEWKSKVTELEEQLRDVMFFVEARDKLQDGEAAGGSIEVAPAPSSHTNGKKKKGKKG
ncbi:zf-UBP-domain-containing protein [Panus rudis PR-1116 ss-1]|nr:zf-UBP-domain-containing protein [Panus rudis PR-1116 ss-1]